MSLNLITGAKKSGKTERMIELLKIAPADSYMLVPERNLLFYEKTILEKLGEASAFLTETLSFRKLSLKLIEGSDKFGTVRLLDNETRNMILSSVIMSNKKSLKLYREGGKSDYCEMVSSQITEFKRHLITRETIESLIEDEETPPSLKDKLHDLKIIFPEYEKRLSDTFSDCDDIITTAARISEETNAFENKKVYIDGFTGFTAQELLLIKSMLTCGAEVFVSLDYTEQYGKIIGDLYYSVGITKRKLASLCGETKIINCDGVADNNPEKEHLIKNYMTAKGKYKEKTRSIFYDVYPTPGEETNAAVSYVAEKIAGGAEPGDFLIIAADFERSLHFLGKQFEGFNIPYYGDIKNSVSELPVYSVIESVFEIILAPNNTDTAINYLKSVCVSEKYRQSGFVFENFLRSSGIKGYILFGGGGVDKLISSAYKFDRTTEPQIREIYDKFILPLVELRAKIKKGASAKEYSAALYRFFEDISLPDIVTEIAEEFEKDGNRVRGLRYVQVYNALIEILEKSCLILSDSEISFVEFKNILNDNLSAKSIAGVPLGCNNVLITGLHSVPAETFPYVIFINANDGVLIPAAHEGFINEEDRRFMQKKGVELSLSPEEKTTEEYLKIFTVMTSFTKELIISSARFDPEGGELVQAEAVGYLYDIFDNIGGVRHTEKIYTKKTLLTEGVMDIYGHLKSEGADKLRALYNDKEFSASAGEVIKRIGTPPKTDIVIDGIVDHLPETLPISITSFEKYRSCAFSYYLRYILKGKERDIYSINNAGIGTLSHMVLQRFSEKVKKDGRNFSDIDTDYIEKTIDPIVKRAVREVNDGLFASSRRAKFMAKKVKRSVKRTLMMLKEHFTRGEFTEYGFEMTFGRPDSSLPGLEIELGENKKILINGTIDRVDTLHTDGNDYIRIVDYKSREKTLDLYEIFYGINIQLITYLMVMLKSEISDKLLPGGVLYLSMENPLISVTKKPDGEALEAEIRKKLVMHGLILKNNDVAKAMDKELFDIGSSDIIDIKLDKEKLFASGNVLSLDEFELLFAKTAGNIKKEAEKIFKGKFEIRPVKNGDSTSCDYCPYAPICCFDDKLCGAEEIEKASDADIMSILKEGAV